VLDAVSFAHDKGEIHQDIKPDNIMLGEYGEVMVVDWGTAIVRAGLAKPTGRLIGTPAYMAPEQARREGVDERSDVYALGATFFQMITLRHPSWESDPDAFWKRNAKARSIRRRTPSARRFPRRRWRSPSKRCPRSATRAIRASRRSRRQYTSISLEKKKLWPCLRRLCMESSCRGHFTPAIQDALMLELFWQLARAIPLPARSARLNSITANSNFAVQLEIACNATCAAELHPENCRKIWASAKALWRNADNYSAFLMAKRC